MFPVIIQTRNLALIHRIGDLRYQVWREEKADLDGVGSRGRWVEHYDIDAIHFVAVQEDSIVAAARITLHDSPEDLPDNEAYRALRLDLPGPIASFNRLVVRRDYRGKGLSTLLDRVRLREAFRSKVSSVIANGVGLIRKNTLVKLGFQFLGVVPKEVGFARRIEADCHIMVHPMKELPDGMTEDKVFHLPASHDHPFKRVG